MTKQWRVVIREQLPYEKAEQVCPLECPFLDCDDVGTHCNLDLGIRNSTGWNVYPGPNCPGPGVYLLVREEGA